MKLLIIFLTTAILQVSASSYAQKITLNEKNTPLEKVIDHIRQQSGFDFVYNDFDLKGVKDVTIFLKDVDMVKSLTLCLENRGLDFEIINKTIIIKKREKSMLTELSDLLTPAGPIKGTVIDADGVGLPGVTIRDKSQKMVTITNVNGEFTLNVEEGTILVFSYIGYKPQEIIVTKNTKKLIVSLEQNISKLDEVSVEGYRKGSQRLATSNISKITAEELDKQPVQDPLQALEGRVPGLVVTQTDGVPGARLNVQIRGRANFDKNLSSDQPLYIIDGVPMAAGNDRVNVQTGPFGPATTNGLSAFAGINMADIESMDVLKDADATAIYGSRGANGVILITTKKGKAGKMTLTANVYSGVSTVTSLTPLLNTQEYLAMRNEALTNDKITTKTNLNAYDLLLWDPNRYTDFEKLLIGNHAQATDAQLSASGGTKYTQYRFGGGYHHETTVYPGDKSSDRASFSFNVNTMSDNEKFTANLSGNYSLGNSTLTAVDLANAVILPPNYRLYDANGNIAWNEGGYPDGKDNPLAQLNQQYLSQLANLNANLVLTYKLTKNLLVRSSMGYNTTVNDERRITPISAQNPTKANLSGLLGLGYNQLKNWIVEPQAEYNGLISKGKLNILAGATLNQKNTNSTATNATGATSDDLAGSLSAYTTFTATNTLTQYNYQALFGRLNYNWEDKYILNFTGRRDGSSRFGPNFRFSNFGAMGAAWIFTNEDLLKQNKILSYGKLRASYGITGNDQIGEYKYLDAWTGGGTTTYNDSVTLATTKLFNPNLHWEGNKKTEIGLELGFFKDRVLVSASIYQNITSDPLVTYPLPTTTGFPNIIENLDGVEIRNRGLELTLNTQNFTQKDFRWSTDFNLTIPQNILLKFPNLST